MRGNFIPSNTWNATRVNNTEVLLPNLNLKEYSLIKSENIWIFLMKNFRFQMN